MIFLNVLTVPLLNLDQCDDVQIIATGIDLPHKIASTNHDDAEDVAPREILAAQIVTHLDKEAELAPLGLPPLALVMRLKELLARLAATEVRCQRRELHLARFTCHRTGLLLARTIRTDSFAHVLQIDRKLLLVHGGELLWLIDEHCGYVSGLARPRQLLVLFLKLPLLNEVFAKQQLQPFVVDLVVEPFQLLKNVDLEDPRVLHFNQLRLLARQHRLFVHLGDNLNRRGLLQFGLHILNLKI